jgi:protein O-GlcNAc transferase
VIKLTYLQCENSFQCKGNYKQVGSDLDISDHSAKQSSIENASYVLLSCLRRVTSTIMDLAYAARLEREGKFSEAEAICRKVLASQPRSPEAHHLLGTILYERGQNDDAIAVMQRGVAFAPGAPQLRVNLAAMLGRAGRHEESLGHLTEALRTTGNIPDLHNNLGVTLEALERYVEAVAAYRTAIQLRPNYPEAHFNLGNALRKMGRIDEAAAEYRTALRLRPDYAKGYDGLANVATEIGELDQTLTCFRKMIEMNPTNAGTRSALLYTIHYHPDYDAEALFREHKEWGRRFCDPLRGQIPPHENDRAANRRLRIGYVSPDFREHTVPRFIGCALEHHDHAQFEIFCYSDVDNADSTTEWLQSLPDHWKNTAGWSDASLEKLIRDDRIDILVDLRGHAAHNRMTLFARKPAPVQVNMVGYFDTTGLATMDWRITDEHQDPPGLTEQYHTEQLARIPHTCWCYTVDGDAPEVGQLPAMTKGYVTFGSLNKIIKVTEPCAKLWAKVLEAVPRSRLVLVVNAVDPAAALRQRLMNLGLPVDRVIVAGKVRHRREYLERFNAIDIALDTFPFNGITTTCDGLWMGVPLITLSGKTSVSRSSRSIMHGLGLPELATSSPEEFVRVATELALDIPRLQEMRMGMRPRMAASHLMDHRGFTAHLEAAYRTMWTRFLQNSEPVCR